MDQSKRRADGEERRVTPRPGHLQSEHVVRVAFSVLWRRLDDFLLILKMIILILLLVKKKKLNKKYFIRIQVFMLHASAPGVVHNIPRLCTLRIPPIYVQKYQIPIRIEQETVTKVLMSCFSRGPSINYEHSFMC